MVEAEKIQIRRPRRDELSAVRTLRNEELNSDQPLSEPLPPTAEDLDPASIHVAAFDGDLIVGVARVNPITGPPHAFLITRVATRKEYRGQGIGRRIMQAAEQLATEQGAHTLILDARPEAEEFYTRLGYERLPDRVPEFEAHIPMKKQVGK